MPSMSSYRRKTVLACVTVLATLAALPALAGTIYLPHAEYRQENGEFRQVILWATNPTAEPQSFTLRFIPTNTDGRQSAGAPQQYQVPPAATIPVGVAPLGAVGMAVISGYDHLAFVGELNVLTSDNRLITSTEVPLVGSDDVVAPRTWAHLMALERDHLVRSSDLGIVNLGQQAGQCTVAAFRADGSLIQAPPEIHLPASGHRFFADAFGLLGEPQLDGGRFQVSCSEPFWIYATSTGRIPEFAKFAVPATTAQSALTPPGAPPVEPPANPPPSTPPPSNPPPTTGTSGELLRRDGTFLAANQGNSYLDFDLPIGRGQRYRSITVDFDVDVGRFPTDLYVGTVGLMRPVKGGTYYAHTVRADRGKSILDMGVGDNLVHRGGNDVWRQNTSYHVRVHYNGGGNQIIWELFRGGSLVERLVGRVGKANLVHNGEGMKIFFGLGKAYDGAFFPPWGWRFSNLVVHGQAQ